MQLKRNTLGQIAVKSPLHIDSPRALVSALPSVRLLLAGPCGVGKTALGRALKKLVPDLELVEHDALKVDGYPRACSITGFDPFGCFYDRVSSADQFVIDIGGGCVFRGSVDSEARLERMTEFKHDLGMSIVLLTADLDVLQRRFLSCKQRHAASFDGTWSEWVESERGFWLRCADLLVDVSGLALGD